MSKIEEGISGKMLFTAEMPFVSDEMSEAKLKELESDYKKLAADELGISEDEVTVEFDYDLITISVEIPVEGTLYGQECNNPYESWYDAEWEIPDIKNYQESFPGFTISLGKPEYY